MSVWSWGAGCVSSAAKYGAQGAALGGAAGAPAAGAGAVPGAAIGGIIGGAYGCLFANDGKAGEAFERQVRKLEHWWKDTKRQSKNLWRQSGNAIKDIGAFFGASSGGKKPKVKQPTLEEGIGLMIHHLQHRVAQGQGQVAGQWVWEVQQPDGRWMRITSHPARWVLHPSNLAALYGPSAASWDADEVYHLIAVMFRKTPPEWNPALRFSMSYKRVGDFLVQAGPDARIDDWPLFDAEFEREEMRRRLLAEMDGQGGEGDGGNVKGSAASLEGGSAHLVLGVAAALLGGAALVAGGGVGQFKEVLG